MLTYDWTYGQNNIIDAELNAKSLYKLCRNVGAELLQYDYSLGLGMYDLGAFTITSNEKVVNFLKTCTYYICEGGIDKIGWFVLLVDESLKDDKIFINSKKHSACIYTSGI